VELFDPASAPSIKTTREFKARLVLVSRDTLLAEESAEAFAAEHGFRMLMADQVALNPAVHFRVERFAPAADFKPSKPFVTRLLWRDLDGNDQSRLLLSEPEAVLAIVTGSSPEVKIEPSAPRPRSPRKRRPAPEARA
jgi:hypothetical protein